jgi:hypothetical protein
MQKTAIFQVFLVPLCTVILYVFVPLCANVEIEHKRLEPLELFGTVQPARHPVLWGLKMDSRSVEGNFMVVQLPLPAPI